MFYNPNATHPISPGIFPDIVLHKAWSTVLFCQPLSMSASGRSLPIMVTTCVGQIRCNRWSERMQVTGPVECKSAVALAEALSPEPWLQVEQGASCDPSDMATFAEVHREHGATLTG